MPATADFFDITPRNWRARLAVSVDLMREISRYTDPDETYRVFVRRMSQLYPTSRQLSISRRDLARPAYCVTRYNLWPEQVNPYKQPNGLPVLNGGLLADLLYADEPRVIDDLRVPAGDPAAEYLAGQRSLLAIPLFDQGVATNMLIVTREEPSAFPREQVPELVWMSNLFGRSMQQLVLSEQLREMYQAAEYERKAIGDLQHGLLPAALPKVPGVEVAVHYRAANRAGGDYYDFFPLPGGRLGVLVADVSGHGTPASVLMAITHTLAHSFPVPPVKPGPFLGHLNAALTRRYTGRTGHFVTAFYAVIDPISGTLTYANAGHPAPRVSAAGGAWEPVPNHTGLPLGVSPGDSGYAEQVVPFGPGSRLAVATDGVIDAGGAAGEPFGLERLDTSLGPAADPTAVVAGVVAEVGAFTAGTAVADDQTLVVVARR